MQPTDGFVEGPFDAKVASTRQRQYSAKDRLLLMKTKCEKRPPFKLVARDKIVLPDDNDPDYENVFAIAESIPIVGLIQPLIVKRVLEKHGEKIVKKIVLIAGRDKLAAATIAGVKRVACVFIKGDETHSQLVAVSENIWRKHLTVLRQAELVVEYCRLALTPANISGQDGQKSKLGRPRGGVSEAARKLPLFRSFEARRKIIRRAVKIAELAPDVKQAVIKAHLDNNQKTLLKIAKSGRVKEQLKLIAKLCMNDPLQRSKSSNSEETESSRGRVYSPPIQPSPPPDDEGTEPRTTLKDLTTHWGKDGKRLWRRTSLPDREKFFNKLRRVSCRVQGDAVELLETVIRGRHRVEKRLLYCYGREKGVDKKAIYKAARDLGYKSVHSSRGEPNTWYFENPAPDYKTQMRRVSDEDLGAAKRKFWKPTERSINRWDPDRSLEEDLGKSHKSVYFNL